MTTAAPVHSAPCGGAIGAVVWLVRSLWMLVVRNRVAIAVASLIWLIWRSGTQPRRLAYPCQQAAAANLGFLAVLFVPGLARRIAGRPDAGLRRQVAESLALASVLFLLASGGVAVYSQYNAGSPPDSYSLTEGTGTQATVAIVKDADGVYTDAQLNQMVRQAVALAGGLGQVMVDTRGGGSAPWNSPDGKIDVIIIPNMTGLQPGLNTDPRVTRAVVEMAWEAGATSVKLGGAATGDNWTAFREQGYDTNSDRLLDYDTRVQLIDLNRTGTTGACAAQIQYNNVTQITLPTSGVGAAKARSSYYVHNELLKTDVMIVVPSLKNHNLGTITLGLKMRIGTAPQDIYFAPWLTCSDTPFLRWEMHNYNQATKFPWNVGTKCATEPECVQRSLVDLNLVRPHDFVVIDALVGCESGPLIYDEPSSRVKSIMASRDTLAIDTIGALVMGYDPDKIPCLNMANDTQKLGVKDRRLITVVGDHVKNVRVDFSLTHPTGYATPYRAESVSPTLGGISLTEGQAIPASESTTIICTGVSDNVGVIKAELTVDGQLAQIVTDPGSTFSFDWNTLNVSQGSHQVAVTVYDAAMNEAKITRNVNVVPPVGPFIWVSKSTLAQTFYAGEVPAADTVGIKNIGTGMLNYTVTADRPWLAGFPINGSSTGEEDVIPVTYATSLVGPGTHTGTLTVTSPEAPNSPQTVTITLTVQSVQSDFDGDGDVDQSDFGWFQVCLTGAGAPQNDPACIPCDLDGDRDVDQNDFGLFQRCLGGANVFAPRSCEQ